MVASPTAKPPNLIDCQYFRLYGISGSDCTSKIYNFTRWIVKLHRKPLQATLAVEVCACLLLETYFPELQAVWDVLWKHEGCDQVVGGASLSTMWTERKYIQSPDPETRRKAYQNKVQALVPSSLLHACDTYMWQSWVEWNIITLSILFQSHYCTVTQSFVGSIHTVMNTWHVYTLYKPRP